MQRTPAVPLAHITVMTGSFGASSNSRGNFSNLSKSILSIGFSMGVVLPPCFIQMVVHFSPHCCYLEFWKVLPGATLNGSLGRVSFLSVGMDAVISSPSKHGCHCFCRIEGNGLWTRWAVNGSNTMFASDFWLIAQGHATSLSTLLAQKSSSSFFLPCGERYLLSVFHGWGFMGWWGLQRKHNHPALFAI